MPGNVRRRLASLLLVTSCVVSGFSCSDAFISSSSIHLHRPHAKKIWLRVTSSSNGNNIDDIQASNQPIPKVKQTRRKPKSRHPRGYWSVKGNVIKELRLFWQNVGVIVDESDIPAIPSEGLLNHFERNDLRWAISRHGGRKDVSEWLGGARLVPGRWAEAVVKSPEVKQLLSGEEGKGLSAKVPPLSPQSRKNTMQMSTTSASRWQHNSGRKKKGYWDEQRVLVEMLKYLYDCRDNNRPSVWMPRPSELTTMGRPDLKEAIVRFGGHKKIQEQLQLVPYNEWNYFEMQYQLVLELRKFLESKACDCVVTNDNYSSETKYCFPSMAEILNENQTLYDLIQYFGGRKFVASRFGVELCPSKTSLRRNSPNRRSSNNSQQNPAGEVDYGRFNLDFAVKLFSVIREDMMHRQPPCKPAAIQMPKKTFLLAKGEIRLAEEIELYGGYENVARRLGLAIF